MDKFDRLKKEREVYAYYMMIEATADHVALDGTLDRSGAAPSVQAARCQLISMEIADDVITRACEAAVGDLKKVRTAMPEDFMYG